MATNSFDADLDDACRELFAGFTTKEKIPSASNKISSKSSPNTHPLSKQK